MTLPLANQAYDAGRLLAFALRSQNAMTSKEYAELLRRYEEDSTLRTVVDSTCDGLGLRIIYVGQFGLIVSPSDTSPFRLTAEEYRSGMAPEERILHGLIQVAIAAYSFPRAETLAQDDDVQPAPMTARKLAEYLRGFAEAEHNKTIHESPDHLESEERRVWREVLTLALTKETTSRRESPRSLTGMCRYALDYLTRHGLMRLVDEGRGIYQGTSSYRIRLKYYGAHALLEQMRQIASIAGTTRGPNC